MKSVLMREKLIELLEQAKYCSTEELADYLIAAGVRVPVLCEKCESYDPGYIRPDHGWCNEFDTAVRGSGFCHHGERREK